MMNFRLEVEKRKLEIIKVQAAKADMQYRIMEREEDIKRIITDMQVQDARVTKLEDEIKGLQESQTKE